MVVRTLLTVLGFKADTPAARKYEKTFTNILAITKKVIRATKDLAMAVLNTAGEFEQAEVALSTMLRSEEKAAELLKDVTDFAARTPFKLPELVEQTKALVSFRVETEEIIPTMENLGNIAAIVGTKKLPRIVQAFGRVKLAGRATMRQLKTFMTAGVPIIDELADALGVTTEEVTQMVRAGKIGFPELQKAIKNMNREGGIAFNAMLRQSKTFFGILSMIDDQITQIKLEAGKELLPEVKALADEFKTFLEANRAIIVSGLVKFLKGAVKVLAFLFFFIRRVWRNLKQRGVIDALGKAFDDAGKNIGIMVKVIGFLIKNLLNLYDEFKNADGIVGGFVKGLGKIFEFLFNPFKAIIEVIEIIADLFNDVKKWWDDIWKGMGEASTSAVKTVSEGVKNAFEGVKIFIINIWNSIWNFINKIWENIQGIIKSVNEFFTGVAEFFGGGEKAFEQVVRPAGPTQEDILRAGLGGGGVTNNLTVRDITVGVPPGTPEETRRAAATGAENGIMTAWEKILEGGLINAPGGTK